jgi:hypothetical protein
LNVLDLLLSTIISSWVCCGMKFSVF